MKKLTPPPVCDPFGRAICLRGKPAKRSEELAIEALDAAAAYEKEMKEFRTAFTFYGIAALVAFTLLVYLIGWYQP